MKKNVFIGLFYSVLFVLIGLIIYLGNLSFWRSLFYEGHPQTLVLSVTFLVGIIVMTCLYVVLPVKKILFTVIFMVLSYLGPITIITLDYGYNKYGVADLLTYLLTPIIGLVLICILHKYTDGKTEIKNVLNKNKFLTIFIYIITILFWMGVFTLIRLCINMFIFEIYINVWVLLDYIIRLSDMPVVEWFLPYFISVFLYTITTVYFVKRYRIICSIIIFLSFIWLHSFITLAHFHKTWYICIISGIITGVVLGTFYVIYYHGFETNKTLIFKKWWRKKQ